jgi:molecular chaperone DnaJ
VTSVVGVRDALLIAAGQYHNHRLQRLRSPAKDASDLAGVLQDPTIGGFHVQSVIDKPHYETASVIERFFQGRSPGDLLLVHFSCHGIKDPDGVLHFAATNTDPDLPSSTSISADFLRTQMLRSRAKSIVLLLDCCYSGAFLPGMKGDTAVSIHDELAGHGRAVITATSKTEYAWEGDNLLKFEPEPSRFTEAIVNGLRTGDADLDGDGKIAVDELYEYVYERLHRAKARQSPRQWASLEYRVFIAEAKASNSRSAARPAVQHDTSSFPRNRTHRGRTYTVRTELSLLETAFGCVRELVVDTAIRCSTCGATGNASREMPDTCPTCGGGGILDLYKSDQRNPCPTCEGFGTVIQDPCPGCDGDGRVRIRRTLKVKIPKGIEHGSHIHLAGEGEVGPLGGPAADLFLEIVELKDPRFQRTGDDLYASVKIGRSILMHGGTFEIETLEGKRKVRIPSGASPGSLVKIDGEGVPHLNEPGRGNLMLRVTAE